MSKEYVVHWRGGMIPEDETSFEINGTLTGTKDEIEKYNELALILIEVENKIREYRKDLDQLPQTPIDAIAIDRMESLMVLSVIMKDLLEPTGNRVFMIGDAINEFTKNLGSYIFDIEMTG